MSFLGPKGKYVYNSDAGDNWIITRDETLATVPGTGLVALDPANPPAGAVPKPNGAELRGVYWQVDEGQDEEGARKFIVCGTTAAPLYASNSPQARTISGNTGTTTGRVGEKVRFI